MKKLISIIIIVLSLFISGCSNGEWTDPFYLKNLYLNNNEVTSPAYGQLWTENVTTNITLAVANQFYLYTFNVTGLKHLTNLTTKNITITSNGTYLVEMSVSSWSNSASPAETHWHVFVNGIPAEEIAAAATRNLKMQGSTAASGVLYLINGDVVDLRVMSINAGDIVSIDHASLVITRIGV